jgi:hypothetical protein
MFNASCLAIPAFPQGEKSADASNYSLLMYDKRREMSSGECQDAGLRQV